MIYRDLLSCLRPGELERGGRALAEGMVMFWVLTVGAVTHVRTPLAHFKWASFIVFKCYFAKVVFEGWFGF